MRPVYIDEDGWKYTIGFGTSKKVFYICAAEPCHTYRPHPILPHMYDKDLAVEMLEAYAARKGMKLVTTCEV